MTDEPEDPQAPGDWRPDTSRGLPVEIGSAIGDARPWLEAREREQAARQLEVRAAQTELDLAMAADDEERAAGAQKLLHEAQAGEPEAGA